MTDREHREAAAKFAETWADRGDEKQDTQSFWIGLLRTVYGVEDPEQYVSFERPVKNILTGHTNFIDAYILATRVLIEQKSAGIDLRKGQAQSDGSTKTPFQQAWSYAAALSHSQDPRWIVVSDFREFDIHDMERPYDPPEIVYLKDLEKEWPRLLFLVDRGNEEIQREEQISIQAGEIVGELYDALKAQYKDPDAPKTLKSLNELCVRLVFCLYAEDAGVFPRKSFHDYLRAHRGEDRRALIELFRVLDQPKGARGDYLDPDLDAFPYVNGGLFANENIEIPRLGDGIIDLILERASEGFDWSEISPTIFGAVFESTLDPEMRHHGGMHYTSIENIHKVIDPLFLDALQAEFRQIEGEADEKERDRKLRNFRFKLSRMRFLDPACGSGNFLTETYRCLRRLENKVIARLNEEQMVLSSEHPIQVSISQFYGIEINDFAVTVARTALWIAESQMMKETEDIVHMKLDFLPLRTSANIVEGNALRMDWESVVPKYEMSYIMGNPPFVGARLMSAEQKKDLMTVFDGWKNAGDLDYVACWYKKTADLIRHTRICAALVSTNSVTQGAQVPILWKPLMETGVHIDFAHRTFLWDSETKKKHQAHVHCVIVGFSIYPNTVPRVIWTAERPEVVEHINGYLIGAADVFIESRSKPICPVPEIGIGNQPIDGGNYLFTEAEKDEFLQKEPTAAKWFHPWYGAQEFINRKPRYCLWLGDCPPNELRKMPGCMRRVEAVRQFRLKSKRSSTLKLADAPTRFQTENMPKGTYIVIPEVSSERRRYVPMGFMTPDILCSNLVKLVPNTTLYHFGVLTSSVHMAWMRAVCGRLKSDYRYSKDIVYNNFPWPDPTPEQRAQIEQTAQEILDARALFPNASLADLYDGSSMPQELRLAHRRNDYVVMRAYGFVKGHPARTSESALVAALMERYQRLARP